jgi:regulator of protease activity HflC (stomatin/prohibitin superfamily)
MSVHNVLRDKVKGRLKFAGITAVLVGFLFVAGCTVLSHATTIQSGEAGILNKTFGSGAGVQLRELGPGWHWRGIGEKIIVYPTRQRVYSFTREGNADGQENEEIAFADQTGLPMTADVNLTIRVRDDKAADLYAEYRLPFDELIDNPIRNDVRSFLAREAEKVPVSCSLAQTAQPPTADGVAAPAAAPSCPGSLMGQGRQAVLQKAFVNLRAKWAVKGVEISDMQWVGPIRYPEAITNAIKNRTEVEQRTLAAQQRKAEAEANAAAQIETARGIAESTRLRGEALRANPEIIDQIYAERSAGLCPPRATTCILGAGAWGLVPQEGK